MKQYKQQPKLLGIIVFMMPMSLLANDTMWFVGANLGGVAENRTVGKFDDGSIVSGRVDDRDFGWKLFAGYRISEHLALELGRVDLNNDPDNETTFTGQSDGSGTLYAAGRVSVDIHDFVAYYLSLVGRVPMPLDSESSHARLSLAAKIGVFAWDAKRTVIDSNGRIDENRDGTDITMAVGLEYAWPVGIAVIAQWEQFKDLDGEDYSLSSLGVKYYF